MKKIFLLLTLSGVLFSFGQSDEKAVKILDDAMAKMKALTSASIEFTMTIKGSGTNESKTGKAQYKGNKYNVDLGDYKIYSNGIKKWVYDGKVCRKCDVEEDDDDVLNPKDLLTKWEGEFKQKYEKETTVNGKKAHMIKLFPKNPAESDYHTAILYVDAANSEILKISIVSNEQTTTTITIKKLTKNPSLPDSTFIFDKAKHAGVEVIDC